MRYFKILTGSDRCFIWQLREDGMERCINVRVSGQTSNWHNPNDIGTNSLEYMMIDTSYVIEITVEEAFLEAL